MANPAVGMADFARNASIALLTEPCHDAFFVEFDFFNVPCLKIALSKILGIGIIVGSMLVKVPQIVKIMSNKSAEGISVPSVTMELYAITASMSYGFMSGYPFSAWGEGLFLALQTAAIAALSLFYGGSSKSSRGGESEGSLDKAVLYLVVYTVILYCLMSGITTLTILRTMQAANVPLILLGKSFQAYTNYKRKNTGQLSGITLGLLFVGSLARIFTSIQETGDSALVITFMVASFANGMIFFQILYYGGGHTKSE